jgi:hypothetical protein
VLLQSLLAANIMASRWSESVKAHLDGTAQQVAQVISTMCTQAAHVQDDGNI